MLKALAVAAFISFFSMGQASPAEAVEAGDRYRPAIVCTEAENALMIAEAFTHSAMEGSTVAQATFVAGWCKLTPPGVATVGEVVRILPDFEDEDMIIYHPVNLNTGETIYEGVFLSWEGQRVDGPGNAQGI